MMPHRKKLSKFAHFCLLPCSLYLVSVAEVAQAQVRREGNAAIAQKVQDDGDIPIDTSNNLDIPISPSNRDIPIKIPSLVIPSNLQTVQDLKAEMQLLWQQGERLYVEKQYHKALDIFRKILLIDRQVEDERIGHSALIYFGNIYGDLGNNFQKRTFLNFARKVGDKGIKAAAELLLILNAYELSVKRQEDLNQPLLDISFRQKFEADQLLRQGIDQLRASQINLSLQSSQRALIIYRQIKDRNGEVISLGNIGYAYRELAQYQKAIDFFRQSLAISKQISGIACTLNSISTNCFEARDAEGSMLDNLGLTYQNLGQYNKAIDFHQQSLAISKEIDDFYTEAVSLGNLGSVYNNLEQYQKALDFYKQSLAIVKQIGDRNMEAVLINNLGSVYLDLGQYNKAIDFSQQSLALRKEIGDLRNEIKAASQNDLITFFNPDSDFYNSPSGEAANLNNLGNAYSKLGQYNKARDFFQQSLAIFKQIGDREGEGITLSNIGLAFSKLNQPEIAILFYKQSVNVRETIRKDIKGLSKEEQKSYLSTVEDTYRNLADLLLKQDRILEAQQVLDLLKVEELSEYLKNVRGNEQTAQGVDLQSPEQNIIALGNELTALQQLAELTPAQKQRLSELTNQEINRNEQFNAFLNTPLIQKQLEELRRIEKAQNVDIEKFNRLRANLRKVKNAVILYPLILEDRLELIIITANTPPIRKTTKIKREQLNTAIAGFLSNLRNPSSANVEKDAQQFYEWIIKPFEAELQQANIQTIIYAPDGQLRYIPLAALHDGKQWLVEKYRINNITASSLTDFTPRDYSELPSVLAAAATNSHNIKLGDRTIPFGALPATKTEVEAIATLLPRTTTLIDQQFSKNVTLQEMKRNTIIHLATHGYFAVGRAEDSFIIFGDGDKATLTDIANWSLTNVSLVVLSACETAIGGKLGSGVEILGLGYRIQDAGAGAAIASLWKVSDDGTSELMQKLYKNLSQKNISSSEALRQAQIAMIRSNKKATSSDRANIRIVGTVPTNQETQLSHPYYWSAFILIGNGF